MFWFLFFPLAYGSVPTAPIAEYDLGSSATQDLGVFDNHAVSVDGAEAFVVDIDSWTVSSFSPCAVSAATIRGSNSELPELWLGCDTGEISVYLWDGSVWTGDGAPLTDVGEGAVRGLVEDGERTIFAIMEPLDDGPIEVALVDTVSIEVTSSVAMFFSEYTDHTVGTNRFIVAHDDYRLSTFNLVGALGNYTTTVFPLDVVDIAPDTVDGAYVLDNDGSVWQFEPDVSLGNQLIPVWSELDNIDSIGVYPSTSEAWLMTADGSALTVYPVTSGLIDSNEVLSSFAYTRDVVQIQTHSHGYHFAGTKDGTMTVLSARPWVADVSVSFTMDEEVVEEDTDTDTDMESERNTEPVTTGLLSVSFSTDVMGTYIIAAGGDWTTQGTTLDQGDLTAPGQYELSIPVDTSDDFWADGENPIYVFVTADDFTGHGKDTLQLEAAPEQVVLDASNIGFDDGALILSFTELSETDIDYYSVYVTTKEFLAEQYPAGGPAFDGEDEVSVPIVVSATKPGVQIVQRIEPLTNDVTYYVAVRAMDKSGLEGPMSNVISERPRPSYNATDLSGDPGGFSCASAGSVTVGWGALFVGALMGIRRMRTGLGVLVAAGVFAAFAPKTAEAKEPRGDDTAQWGQFEARYGPVWLRDQRITEIYSGSYDADNTFNHVGQALQFEVGPQFFRVVELDFGVGNFRKADLMQDETGSESTQKTVLNWIPLSVGITGRLHFVDEQLLVPYASYGRDWIVWSEKTEVSEGVMEGVSGVKYGWHWSAGLSIMLDIFDFSRASLLEATYGINDTYLTIEYREQTIDKGSQVNDGEDQLSFSGRMVTAGLKFDF